MSCKEKENRQGDYMVVADLSNILVKQDTEINDLYEVSGVYMIFWSCLCISNISNIIFL